ncbi:calcium-binding protein [Oxalobacteraceae bacterium CAVE-383]|nr:calcium-binding protein [Oxalobacteraceae bacterium CAVE-383]
MPDANGDFVAPVAKSAIEKVQVVDVDMVLQLKDGTSMVLAGGAISAMDASHTEVKFSDGLQGLSKLFDLVGTIAIPKLDPILSSLQGHPNSEGQGAGANANQPAATESAGLTASVTSQIVNQLTQIVQANAQSVTIKTVDPSAKVAVLSQSTKTGDVDSQPLQHTEPPIPPERPGVIPQEHIIGPDAPAMALSLVNLTTITQIGNVLYGSGGTPASATDAGNNAQFASQVINAPANATEIHAGANIPTNDFIKVVDITLTGNGIAQSIEIKGVPAGMSIANGTDLGGGVWSIPVVSGQRDYAIQIEYTTVPANPQTPIHQQFSMEFDVTMTTADGIVNLSQVKQFVVKDVNSANDLTFIDSTTGESVYVLPAQGNSHIVHAGDAGVTIIGSNANDFLFGGAGADTINGGTGNTYLEGGGGADHLNGGVGGINTAGYTLSATGVTVDLVAGTGTGGDAQGDTLTNIQNVIGSTHNDIIVASAAANNINGGGHDSIGGDTVSYAGSGTGVIIDLAAGTGTGGNAAGDKLTGIQNVIGSDHNDTFFGSSEGNAFDGGLHDLNGANTVSYANDTSGTGAIVNLATGHGSGAAAGDSYVNIQNIIGTAFNDTFIDGAGANRYDGGVGGNDTVDYSNAGAGVTVNFVTGHGAGDIAEGDTFVNVQNVIGSNFDDVFTAGIDSKNFNGGAGFDTVRYDSAASGIIIDAINNVGRGAAAGNTYTGIEAFVGGGSDDMFIASADANSFNGGAAGSDTVDYSNSNAAVTVDLFFTRGQGTSGGYAQGDVLVNIANVIGSAGDDLFLANSVQNSFEGGGGNNTVSYEHSSSADSTGVIVDLSATDGSGTSGNYALGDKFSNIQNVIGSAFNDTFVASSVANVFTGGGGIDTVSYAKSTSADGVTGVTVDLSTVDGLGGAGHGHGNYAEGDTIINVQNAIGSIYNDTFIGGAVANTFTGGGGSDTVSYAGSTAVTVDLVNGVGVGGNAEGDKYINVQNVIGGDADDTIIDNLAANTIDGGTVSLHNRVSYANSVSSPGVAAGVTVDLTATDGTGTSGGYATGDKLSNIQDLTGSAADDTFVASLAANNLDGGASTAASHNRVSYDKSVDGSGAAAGVTVDLVNGVGTGGYAQGDTYANIQDVTGSKADDLIIDSAAANTIDGGTGSLHNTVSYANSVTSTGAAAGVTINLNLADGSGNSGGYAVGDKLSNIQNLVGSQADDTFVASAAANFLDGGTGSLHNRVDYSASVDAGNAAAAVTVDLSGNTGTGGYAQGDTYANIQDVTGSGADDLFIASTAANNFDGGVSTAASHNRVSYSQSGTGVVVDLSVTNGNGTSGGAAGDTFVNIQDITGSNQNDTFVASTAANNFDGGTGSDTVSYARVTGGVGVTVDLTAGGALTGGAAAGDTYTSIENVIGSANNDLFIDGGGAVPNAYTGGGGVDRISYDNSAAGVNVDFGTGLNMGTGTGSYAQGDTYVGIQNVTGSKFDDNFTASTTVSAATANAFDGNTGTLHNRVLYTGTGTGVTVNLSNIIVNGVAAGSGGGGAAGDTYANIQDITGTTSDDRIIASAAANNIDGGTGSLHNRVDYTASVDAGNAPAGVTVDLSGNTGTGGYAQGDTYANIQDVTGSGADDLFIASAAANNFDGGVSTAASHNRVSYLQSATGVVVDLSVTDGTGTSGGAAGDTFVNIQDITGSNQNDTFVASTAANNFDGGTGSDTVSYARVTGGVGVTVDLTAGGALTGGAAAGDTYTSIENVIGSANNDLFIDGGGAVPNAYTGGGGVDRISYDNSAAGVNVDFGTGLNMGTGTGSYAQGDTYVGIQNVTGSKFDDNFTASTTVSAATANAFDGNTGTLHNRVLYTGTGTGVTVNLSNIIVNGVAAGSGGGGAAGDTYANIQDITGTASDDTIVASSAANNIDGGASTAASHNRVDYSASVDAGNVAVGVTVDLLNSVGTGGYAQGDTYANIQDVTGSGAADTFVASAAANKFDGGAGSDTVDYSTSTAIIVNLSALTQNTLAAGTGSGGLAAGDTYTNIENIKGGAGNDLFYAGTAANAFTGGGGIDTVSYVSSTNGVTASLIANAVGSGGDAAGDTFSGITNLTGSAQNDTLTGLAAGGSTLNGGAGSDTLNATGDNNIFIGGAGGDTMTGNGGLNNTADYTGSGAVVVDLFFTDGTGTSGGDATGDKLSGIQNVKGSGGNDTFFANSVANVFTGNGGTDTVSYSHSTTTVIASLLAGVGGTSGDATGDTYNAITNLTGGSGDDTLTGLLAGGSTLVGNAGNDRLIATGGNNVLMGGAGADNMSATGANNTASYAGSTNGNIIVDLTKTDGTGTSGGDAAGDILSGIQNVIGGLGDDKFILDHNANIIDGGNGSNTVSYEHETTINVTVDLSGTGIANGDGLFGAQDTLTNIQNAIGGGGNDIFLAGNAHNFFDGGGGVDTVSYANNNGAHGAAIAANTAGVTVDFHGNIGSGNWAAGDTYTNIENVIGTTGNDTFIDAGDGVHNIYNGGANGAGSNDTVSYQFSATGGALTLSIDGTHANAGNAAGDVFTNIANLTGSDTVNSELWGDGNANILTAMGSTNTNILHGNGGGAGTDVLDGRLGGHNTLIAGDTGSTTVDINASADPNHAGGSILGTNIDQIVGSTTGAVTVKMFNLTTALDISSFSATATVGGPKVSHITTLDLSGDGVGTQISISANDVIALGNNHQLSVRMDGNDSINLVLQAGEHSVLFGNGDYAFFDANNVELARIHQLT